MATNGTPAIPGIDLERLDEFSEFALENPNDVLLGIEAKTVWEGYAGDRADRDRVLGMVKRSPVHTMVEQEKSIFTTVTVV